MRVCSTAQTINLLGCQREEDVEEDVNRTGLLVRAIVGMYARRIFKFSVSTAPAQQTGPGHCVSLHYTFAVRPEL